MSTHPTLTAAITNFNHASFLPRAIDAIVTQSRPPDEFILVDDKSTDDSVDIIRDYAARFPMIRPIYRERNGGFVAGMSDALAAATGDYFYAGSADDYIMPGFFQAAMTAAEEFPKAGLVCGDWQMQTIDGTVTRCRFTTNSTRRYISARSSIKEFLLDMPPLISPSPATIYRREKMVEAGAYRPELWSFGDTCQILCISSRYGAVYVPAIFATNCFNPHGLGSSDFKNFGRFLSVINKVSQIMQTDFADVFSPQVVRQWRSRSVDCLVRQHVHLTAPYQDVLKYENLIGSQLPLPQRMLQGLLRKMLSMGVLYYQYFVRRGIVERLILGDASEQDELISLITAE